MPKSQVQLKQLSSLPITWLSEGRLKLSILLRHEAARTSKTQEALKYLLQEQHVPNSILSAFPNLREPDKHLMLRASDEYLRCILAKSIAEVYRNMTPKYRNEAARKQFFKRLVGLSEAIHLSDSSERLHEVLTTEPTDELTTQVISGVERLTTERVDLAAEYNAKQNGARVEFRSYLTQLENITGVMWHESERYQRTLSILSIFPPGVFENERTWRWGSQWFPAVGVLNINPPVLFLDNIRRGILAREAAILLTPRNMDSMEQAPRALCEQAEFVAYKLLAHTNDKMFWSEARHGPRQATRFRGHELIDFFQFYEMMIGDSLYRQVWSRLKEFGDARLAVSDYYAIFNNLASRPTNPRFERDELELLKLLSKRPSVPVGEAARILGVSIPTTAKAIRDLSKKAGLLFTVVVDLSRMGLIENLALISTDKQGEVLRVLSRFPYCRQVFRTYGPFDLFVVLDTPEEFSNFARRFLDKMLDSKFLSRYTLLQLRRDFHSVNFDNYNAVQGRWDVHWDAWGLSLRESLSKSEFSGLGSPIQGQRFQFDKLDLNILSMMHVNCRMPFSTIGRDLGVSGAYIGKKISRMMRENVFKYAIWPQKIGAEDWGMVALSCSKEVADTSVRYLSRLPAWRGGLVTGDFEGLVALVWCPSGELKQLFKAIDDRLVRNGHAKAECLGALGEWLMSRWLPVEPNDPWQLCTDDGRWLFDDQKYMALIQHN